MYLDTPQEIVMSDKVTVLAVDDDIMHTELIGFILSEIGYETLKCYNGLEAIQVLEQHPDIDAILVDLEMPVMNGRDLIQFVTQSEEWRHIPLVALTSSAHEVTHTLSLGASEFLTKPFNREEMQLRVMNQVRNKKLADQANRKLQKSEARLEQLLQSTNQGIFSLDMEGTCTFINKPGTHILGYQIEELVGNKITLLLKCKILEEQIKLCLSQRSIHDDATFHSDDFYLCKKDGSFFPSSLSSKPLLINGMIAGAVITFSDITERKRLEDERFILSRAVEQCPVSICLTDISGNIEFVNPKFTHLTGYSSADVIGKNPRVLKSGEVKPDVYEQLWHTISKGDIWEGELLNKTKDGRLFWEHAAISPLRDSKGIITHYLAVKEDITTMKKVLEELVTAKEQAEAANMAKSSFLATMSHEIRTPMNGVIGMNSMLLETNLTAEQKEYATIAYNSGENLLTIINEILDFSKIEAGKLELEILDFDVRITLEDTAELLALRSEEAGLELICQIDPAVPSYLRGDPGRIRQIITNLVGNAIKFTRKGEVVISASLASKQENNVTILFEIQDTGIGIPESRLSAIFDPFTQADGSTTRRFGGTGLGLAICKQLVGLMNGEIGVTSEEGVGSRFWFSLCLETQTQTSYNAHVFKALQLRGKGSLIKERILVVDDNATNRILMKTLLRLWGCRFEIAVDATEGLEMLHEAVQSGDPFRLAILDQEMPGMDGMELGRCIKTDPLLSSTLMVMLTSIGQRGDAATLEQIGFAGYLHKPVRQNQLYDCLELIVGRDIESGDYVSSNPPQGIITKHIIAESVRKGVRILLVEDNIINQKVAQHMLKSLGYRVDVAADGQEAVRALEMINYDLILMDCLMPVMNGFEATAAIRDASPEQFNNKIPIIAMTANATQDDRQKCLSSGMNDYLSKPIKKELLAELIEKWLEYSSVQPVEISAQTGATPEPELFNEGDMLESMDNDSEFMRSILGDAIESLPDELETLRSLLEGNDAVAIRGQAHTMKGVAANIYAPSLRETCLRIETAAKGGDIETAREILPDLELIFSLTIEKIRSKY